MSIMIPLQMTAFNWLVKILSISVAEFAVLCVGLVMSRNNMCENKLSTTS